LLTENEMQRNAAAHNCYTTYTSKAKAQFAKQHASRPGLYVAVIKADKIN